MANIAIVFDSANQSSTVCPFWLRVQTSETSVEIVELNALSLPQAYRTALESGYDVQSWITGGVAMPIPSGLDHMRRTALEQGFIS